MHPSNFIFHDLDYEKWIRKKPCLVCGQQSEVHHVWNLGKKNVRHAYVSVPLCPTHHRHGFPSSYHSLGKEPFEDQHGINLEWIIIQNLSEYLREAKNEEKGKSKIRT